MVARRFARVVRGGLLGVAGWVARVFWVVSRVLLGGC